MYIFVLDFFRFLLVFLVIGASALLVGPICSVEDGYVELPPAGEALELTGVPGDEINLKLRLPDHADLDERELSVSLRDAESNFTTILPLEVREEDDDGDGEADRFYGRLAVPAVPGRPRATLTGSLEGSYEARGAGRESLSVPFRLEILRRGEGTTSGAEDRYPSFPEALEDFGIVFLFCAFLAFLGALEARDERRARTEVRP